jgi:hypothetical protein
LRILDPKFYQSLKTELSTVDEERHIVSRGGVLSNKYIENLDKETCDSEFRKQVHEKSMSEFIRLSSAKGSQQKRTLKRVKAQFTKSLDKLIKSVGKRQKETIKSGYETFKSVRGSIFRAEVIGQHPTVCKAMNIKKRLKPPTVNPNQDIQND